MIPIARKGENIRKRKDGLWEARYITGYHPNRKAIYQSVYGKSYTEVKEKKKLLYTTNKNTPNLSNLTLGQIFNKWLDTEKGKVKESTYARYTYIVDKHILPQFEEVKVKYLDNEMFLDFISKKQKSGRLDGKGGLSGKTTNDILMILKQGLKNYINFKIEVNCMPPPQDNVEILTELEYEKLVKYLMNEPDGVKSGILLSLFTGMRIGELCALKWKDINVIRGEISINKTMQRIKNTDNNASAKTKIIIDTPKSTKSKRIIPIPRFLISVLENLQCENDCFLLTGKKRKFIEPRLYQKKFKAILKYCYIENINFHALRHTFATRAVENGIDTKTLAEIIGHSDINFTYKQYVHPTMEYKRKQLDKLASNY